MTEANKLTPDFLARQVLHATFVLRGRLVLDRDSDSSQEGCEAGTEDREVAPSIAAKKLASTAGCSSAVNGSKGLDPMM